MTSTLKRTMVAFLAVVALLVTALFVVAPNAQAQVRGTDTTEASTGCVLMKVHGKFTSPTKAKVLARINAIRKEAYKEGLVSKYVPIKWATNLEWIAQTRAAEAAVRSSHTRPNGESCFSISHNTTKSSGECLAWSGGGMMQGINLWYAEKKDYVNKTPNAVTGHYELLINPTYTYIGLGCFVPADGGWTTTSAEFSYETGLSETRTGALGDYWQVVEVKKGAVSAPRVSSTKVSKGKIKTIYLKGTISFSGNYYNHTAAYCNGVTYFKGNSRVKVISRTKSSIKVKGVRKGKCNFTFKFAGNGKKRTVTLKVS